MDTFEILSTIRNYSGLDSEDKLGTPLLRRSANLGMHYVAQVLQPIFAPFLARTRDYAAQSGASIGIPGDVLRIIDFERKNTANLWKTCTAVAVEDRGQIARNANYPGKTEEYPAYVHEGREVYIYPELSSTDIRMRYRRRLADMADGVANYESAASAALGGNAKPEADFYIGYDVAVYVETSGSRTLKGIYRCTGYTAAKVATLSGTGIFLASGETYYFALVPILPEEFHNLVVDAGLIELKKSRRFDDGSNWKADLDALNARLGTILKAHGAEE